jgi:hypothetical protein
MSNAICRVTRASRPAAPQLGDPVGVALLAGVVRTAAPLAQLELLTLLVLAVVVQVVTVSSRCGLSLAQ